jgi:hypothetical protein
MNEEWKKSGKPLESQKKRRRSSKVFIVLCIGLWIDCMNTRLCRNISHNHECSKTTYLAGMTLISICGNRRSHRMPTPHPMSYPLDLVGISLAYCLIRYPQIDDTTTHERTYQQDSRLGQMLSRRRGDSPPVPTSPMLLHLDARNGEIRVSRGCYLGGDEAFAVR